MACRMRVEAIIFTFVLCIQNAFFLFLYGIMTPTAATNCYAPNGGLIDFFTYLACSESGSGPCCSNADMCLSNGLCFDSGADNIMAQAGCTDSGFNAAGCVIICSSMYTVFILLILLCPFVFFSLSF
jgi:hypothetical protein